MAKRHSIFSFGGGTTLMSFTWRHNSSRLYLTVMSARRNSARPFECINRDMTFEKRLIAKGRAAIQRAYQSALNRHDY